MPAASTIRSKRKRNEHISSIIARKLHNINLSKSDPGENYARKVLKGDIVAGKLVKAQCRRHFEDKKRLAEQGFYYDYDEASHVIEFLNTKCVTRQGDRLKLLPFQEFFASQIFGWKNKDGHLRYRNALLISARNAGKTVLLAAMTVYKALNYSKPSDKLYCVAATLRQSDIIYDDVIKQARLSPFINKFVFFPKMTSVRPNQIVIDRKSRDIRIKAITNNTTSDFSALMGITASMAVIEEMQSFTSSSTIQIMRSSFKDSYCPLMIIDSNPSAGKNNPLFDEYKRARKILKGELADETYFPLLFMLDTKDDPFNEDEKTIHYIWPKANPGLPYGMPDKDYLVGQLNESYLSPSIKRDVHRLNFGRFVESAEEEIFFSPEIIHASERKPRHFPTREMLEKMDLFVGFDPSKVNDLSAIALVYRSDDTPPKFYIDNAIYVSGRTASSNDYDYIDWKLWQEKGYVSISQEEYIDKQRIVDDLLEIKNSFRLISGVTDYYAFASFRSEAEKLGLELVGSEGPQTTFPGIRFYRHRQGSYRNKNTLKESSVEALRYEQTRNRSMKRLQAKQVEFDMSIMENLIQMFSEGKVIIKSNPCVRMALSSMKTRTDMFGNVYPDRKSSNFVDPALAIIMGINLAYHASELQEELTNEQTLALME